MALATCATWACDVRAQRVHIDASLESLHGATASQVLARGADGTRYAVTRRPGGEIHLHVRRPGETRFETLNVELADEQSGVDTTRPNNTCALTIDSKGVLHILWARYYYPKFHEQYYRRYDPRTGHRSPIVKTSHFGGIRCQRSQVLSLAVDADDRVYIAAPSSTSWQARLLRVAPGATRDRPQIEDLGRLTPSWSSQHVAMAVDTRGRVHCAFYSNRDRGVLAHVYYVPDGDERGWWPRGAKSDAKHRPENIAQSPMRTIFGADLVCDVKGFVHLLYVTQPEQRKVRMTYRRWSPTDSNWEAPIEVARFEIPPLHNPNNFHALAVDDDGARVFVSRRAFVDPREKRKSGIAIHVVDRPGVGLPTHIEHSSLGPRRYERLTARYALYPASNRLHGSLDLTYSLPGADGSDRLRAWLWPLPAR